MDPLQGVPGYTTVYADPMHSIYGYLGRFLRAPFGHRAYRGPSKAAALPLTTASSISRPFYRPAWNAFATNMLGRPHAVNATTTSL